MVQPAGPMWPGGFETIVQMKDGQRFETLYLPDLHNDDLQAAGKAPVYYWLPNGVRIARKGDTQDYKFHLTHFVGVMSEDTTVGVSGTSEVAGGVLALTVTAAPPLDALQESHKQLAAKLRGDGRKYWTWSTPAEPQFAPVPISDSRTHMSSLSPTLDGTVPSEQPAGGAGGSGTASPPAPAPAGGPAGAPGTRSAQLVRQMKPRLMRQPRTVRAERDNTPDNLDAWYMRIEGQGPGSLNPAGENAYVALCGALPAALLYSGFHGVYSPIVVSQTLNLKVWSETLKIKIDGNWDRIFEHFSAAAQGRAWWFSADIKAEFNNLRISGGITVEVEIDGTNPGADKMKEAVDKRIDAIVAKFTEQAKARIFDPAPPEVKPAEAPGGGGLLSGLFGGFGGGFALKYRRDETKLDLQYDETRQERFNLSTTISSSLEGFYNEIKADPDAEQKYFTNLYLEDFNRKITHNVKPVVNWSDPAREWVGDPVAFLGVQIGYPSANGDIQWVPHVFQSTDTTPETTWQPAMAKKDAADVVDPPPGWTPDTSYVKRTLHFSEPPDETENPYVRCYVEKNVVDLDPEPNGTATNDLNIEVRADNAGKLNVGPMALNVSLDTPAQFVEVEFQALGTTDDGNERPITKFVWKSVDQDKDRYWTIFTGQRDFLPRFRYRCHVVVRGSIFTKGMEWWGPWVDSAGNGPLMVSVPTPDEAVQTRSLVKSKAQAALPPAAPPTPISRPAGGSGAGKPAAKPAAKAPAGNGGAKPAPAPAGPPVRASRDMAGDSVQGWQLSGGKPSAREERSTSAAAADEPAPPVAGYSSRKPASLKR